MTEENQDQAQVAANARLKRQRDALQEKLDKIQRKKDATLTAFTTAARGLRKVVSAFVSASDLQDEMDRRDEFGDLTKDPSDQRRADRNRDSYRIMYTLLGEHLRSVMIDPEADMTVFWASVWNVSGVARSEDNGRVRRCLASWLNEAPYNVRPLLRGNNRENRGIGHNDVGAYVVSIKTKWSEPDVRALIRAGDPTHRKRGGFWFSCLYGKNRGDPEDLEKGFLRGSLLVKTFCAIFIADLSTDDVDDNSGDDEPNAKRAKIEHTTKQNISKLLKMDNKATPRSIAYSAVLLHFNLTDAKTWSDTYQGVNYPEFYNFIVDYFENNDTNTPLGRLAQGEADATLLWFSQQAFPTDTDTAIEVGQAWSELGAQRAKKLADAEEARMARSSSSASGS
ncbi:uncharacterized protein SCHCODRAFT_02617806 [Schizophyllum commune H4-8]|uniref:Uncharacterized protein n=1 Tax=Schizophyllum commune (strain H4-8 / FGSC 9210) TaxID=578458 RepID=D8Q391_SCHCM|nr:uncharacterized protein SCHCODRAFT_02617806 [Schizophyllum commune H4-8]KAI5894788.1 hypothetical protein SCHCODRAFT_02617806 [Schizophyllum commune H4-8]